MNIKFNITAIALDAAGRVVLSDEDLRSLEQACDVTTSGGTNDSEGCADIVCDCNVLCPCYLPNELWCS